MMARLRLTTKQVNGGFYKGNRTGSMGRFGANGSTYHIDWSKVRTYVVPENLDEFKLTPFVTKQMAPTKSKYSKNIEKQDREVTIPRNLEAEDYLNIWAIENARESLRVERKPKLLGQAMDAFTKTKAQAKSKKHKSRAIAQAKLRALSKARSEA